jgi:hypothetical protein
MINKRVVRIRFPFAAGGLIDGSQIIQALKSGSSLGVEKTQYVLDPAQAYLKRGHITGMGLLFNSFSETSLQFTGQALLLVVQLDSG